MLRLPLAVDCAGVKLADPVPLAILRCRNPFVLCYHTAKSSFNIWKEQTHKAGHPDIDAFEAMMAREECQKGFFVSFDYSSDALTEINRFFKQTKRVIIPLTVQEILDEQIEHKLA